MKINILHILSSLTALLMILAGCSKDDPTPVPDPAREGKAFSLLLYCVASNSLDGSLTDDKEEMLKVASEIDHENVDVYLYQVRQYRQGDPEEGIASLLRLAKNAAGEYDFITVKDYDRSLYSTDPARISQVISDYESLSPADKRGLILWSHAYGFMPAKSTRMAAPDTESVSAPELFYFGDDKFGGNTGHTNIDELARAIPDNMFSYIWFDCCYMGSIEVAYELKDKCDYMVGYPTEVHQDGMPYDITLPLIASPDPQLVEAARRMYVNYLGYSPSTCVTMAVCDMSAIEDVADATRRAYAGYTPIDVNGLQRFTRGSVGPYYDFGQVVEKAAATSGADFSLAAFKAAMNKFVIYKAASDHDFNYNPIDVENFSGLSSHAYMGNATTYEDYYRTLKWYGRVFGSTE